MDRIKQALTRKIGPLPAWGWLTIILVAVYWYRRHTSSTTTAATATTDTTGSTTTPQDPITLQPGESVYNPNDGSLTTAPGGGGGSGSGDGGSSGGSGDNSVNSGVGDTTGTSNSPDLSGLLGSLQNISKGIGKLNVRLGKLSATTKKKAKPKAAGLRRPPAGGNQSLQTAAYNASKGGAKNRPRSGAAIKSKIHTPKAHNPGAAKGTSRTVRTVRPASTVRQHQLTPMTRATVRQRPTATSVKPPATEHPANPPRPSSPPPRTHRKGKRK